MEELMKELQQAFAEFKKTNDARLKAIESKGYAPADVEEKTNRLNDEITRLEGELKKVQTAMNRSGQGAGGNEGAADEKKAAYKKALNSYLRKGVEMPAEVKAMTVDSDEDGGFFVTPEMSSEIVTKVFESSPIRQLASVQTIGSDSLEIIEDLDEAGSGWVGEVQARPETDTPQIKKIIIPVHELYAQPKASQKFLDDASVNVEAWLAGKVAEKFARDEATAFVGGDGVARPKGLLSYANGTGFNQVEQIETAGSGVVAADDLIEIDNALKGAYRNGAVWLMKRQSIKVIRKLKDTQNNYLWQPGLNGGTQSVLLGSPIFEADDMPAVAAGNLSMIFGNIRQAYQVVDRIGIRTLRDPYSAKPFVLFYTTKRVGGGVKNFEAFKILKVKA